jgi:hypothetical protein
MQLRRAMVLLASQAWRGLCSTAEADGCWEQLLHLRCDVHGSLVPTRPPSNALSTQADRRGHRPAHEFGRGGGGQCTGRSRQQRLAHPSAQAGVGIAPRPPAARPDPRPLGAGGGAIPWPDCIASPRHCATPRHLRLPSKAVTMGSLAK